MSFLTIDYHCLASQHGDSWLDYFSIGIEPISEFRSERLPNAETLDLTRIDRELRGEFGIPRSFVRKRKELA